MVPFSCYRMAHPSVLHTLFWHCPTNKLCLLFLKDMGLFAVFGDTGWATSDKAKWPQHRVLSWDGWALGKVSGVAEKVVLLLKLTFLYQKKIMRNLLVIPFWKEYFINGRVVSLLEMAVLVPLKFVLQVLLCFRSVVVVWVVFSLFKTAIWDLLCYLL